MSTFPDGVYEYGGVPVGGLKKLDMGNIYYCAATTNSLATYRFAGKHYTNDGSAMLHSTIQSALDATVTQRNDYVILLDNFTLAAALTMTKSRVHLISPQGIKVGGWVGDRSITQGAAADCITVTGNGVEIAGIWFNSYQGSDIIDVGTTWVINIHHNYFAMGATASSDNYGIVGTATIQPSIHHNFFTNHSPGAMSGTDNDIAAFIGITSGAATRGYIADNVITTGLNTAVAAAIQWSGCEVIIARNVLWESAAHGASEAGVFTLGISTAADNIIVDNKIGITTGTDAVSGGTSGESYVSNYESASGATVAT